MTIPEVSRVLSIGAGTMGKEIGIHCAAHGYDVVIYDISTESLKKAETAIPRVINKYVQMAIISSDAAEGAIKRILLTDEMKKAAESVDLLIESVPESPSLKKQVFSEFNTFCPPHTIFTTNTSTLLPSMFAESSGRPDRFCAFHFHLPIWLANVADIMPHPGTSEITISTLRSFAKSIGQIPLVLKKEKSGYIFNTMVSALIQSALSLAEREVATVEDIDRAWMGCMKMPVGPFGLMDMIGLETVWHISSFWAEETKDPQIKAIADFVKSYLDKGLVGMKGKKGFYTYPNPVFQDPGFLSGMDGS